MDEEVEDSKDRKSLGRMMREDGRMQAGFAFIAIGVALVATVSILTFTEKPYVGFTDIGLLILVAGSGLSCYGVLQIRKRYRTITRILSLGQEVKAKVTDCRIGSSGKAGTRTEIVVEYTFLGKNRRSKTLVAYAVPLAIGMEIPIIVNPDTPDKFVLRDSYLSDKGAIEASTDTCSVCQEEIAFLEVDKHMRQVHPREYVAWRLWMVVLVVSIVIPFAAMVLSVVVFNDERVLIVCVVGIAFVVGSQFAIDRLGKRWEKKVSDAWKARHSGRRKH